jgi:molybdopterin-guanine dinucleotide biosynthesis protein A
MSNKIAIPLVIFAGGKSSRMGEDKSLLPFGRYSTLTEYQLKRFEMHFDSIYISCKSRDKFDFTANFIEDNDQEVFSPLVAISSIFQRLSCDSFLALSVDTPFVSIDTLSQLIKKNDPTKIATIAKSDYIEPLCCVYNQNIKPIIKDSIEQNRHKLTMILKDANIVQADIDEFKNLNNKSDYLEALNINNK